MRVERTTERTTTFLERESEIFFVKWGTRDCSPDSTRIAPLQSSAAAAARVSSRAMKMHYVPQFVLREMSDGNGLYELEIKSGRCERRNPAQAGFEEDLYPAELETGLLQRMDDLVARLYRKWIVGKKPGDPISLKPWQRQRIAEWLILSTIRTPRRMEQFQQHLNAHRSDPRSERDLVYSHEQELLTIIRDELPDLYREAVTELGEATAHAHFMAEWLNKISASNMSYLPPAKDLLAETIKEDRLREHAEHLLRLTWGWASSNSGFWVSDNPLAVWHPQRTDWVGDFGIAIEGVEISFPFSHSMTLVMRAGPLVTDRVMGCNRLWTNDLNERQRRGAFKFLFGPFSRMREFAKAWEPKREALAAQRRAQYEQRTRPPGS
jgi:hypothetical protein